MNFEQLLAKQVDETPAFDPPQRVKVKKKGKKGKDHDDDDDATPAAAAAPAEEEPVENCSFLFQITKNVTKLQRFRYFINRHNYHEITMFLTLVTKSIFSAFLIPGRGGGGCRSQACRQKEGKEGEERKERFF